MMSVEITKTVDESPDVVGVTPTIVELNDGLEPKKKKSKSKLEKEQEIDRRSAEVMAEAALAKQEAEMKAIRDALITKENESKPVDTVTSSNEHVCQSPRQGMSYHLNVGSKRQSTKERPLGKGAQKMDPKRPVKN